MRVAAVDCGSSSIKLLVADLDPKTGGQVDLVREERIVRLGEGVDRTGRLGADAMQRTFDTCETFAARLGALGADRVGVVATSAARDAGNSAVLVAGLRARLGVTPRLLDGPAEASLSYAGAVRGLAASLAPAAGAGDVLLVDVGGGSTELVRGRGSVVSAVGSADVGSVRLTERHLVDDPATPAQVAAATADTDAALDSLPVPIDGIVAVVAVSGTAMTVAAHVLRLDGPHPERLHGVRLLVDDVRASCIALLAATVAERLAMAVMPPGRADVIGGGALVLDRVLERTGRAPVVTSTHDVLDGLAWSVL